MTCPNCRNPMIILDAYPDVSHCEICGYSFFGENEINRFPLNLATELLHDQVDDRELIANKLCPKCNIPLFRAQEDSIPHFIAMLRCPHCQGVLVAGHDLIAFKRAQHIKISYFKQWQIPIPSLKSVLVYSLVLTAAFAVFSSMQSYYLQNAPKTQAQALIKNIKVLPDGANSIVYFVTDTTYTSTISFYDARRALLLQLPISTSPSQVHLIRITQVKPSSTISFTVSITQNGKTITSDFLPFIKN